MTKSDGLKTSKTKKTNNKNNPKKPNKKEPKQPHPPPKKKNNKKPPTKHQIKKPKPTNQQNHHPQNPQTPLLWYFSTWISNTSSPSQSPTLPCFFMTKFQLTKFAASFPNTWQLLKIFLRAWQRLQLFTPHLAVAPPPQEYNTPVHLFIFLVIEIEQVNQLQGKIFKYKFAKVHSPHRGLTTCHRPVCKRESMNNLWSMEPYPRAVD